MEGLAAKMKAGIVAIGAVVAERFGALAVPLALLVACNLLDYVTGLLAAPRRGQQRNSAQGLAGIVRKIGMWMLVAAGVVVDILLEYLAGTMGIHMALAFPVGCVACVWLLVNEVISVIENIDALGVQVPFLMPLVEWVKKKVEAAAPKPEEGDSEGEE